MSDEQIPSPVNNQWVKNKFKKCLEKKNSAPKVNNENILKLLHDIQTVYSIPITGGSEKKQNLRYIVCRSRYPFNIL